MRAVSTIQVIFASAILLADLSANAQTPRGAQPNSKPTESRHLRGPDGYEGWTLDYPVVGRSADERYPMTLVIARDGRVFRQIEGHPFIWKWMFWSDGQQVAYETGPLHFYMSCVLIDTKTGHEIASFACEYQDLPDSAPGALKTLTRSQ